MNEEDMKIYKRYLNKFEKEKQRSYQHRQENQ